MISRGEASSVDGSGRKDVTAFASCRWLVLVFGKPDRQSASTLSFEVKSDFATWASYACASIGFVFSLLLPFVPTTQRVVSCTASGSPRYR